MELRTAYGFMAAGVSARNIRRAVQRASELLGIDHPLSTTRFKTDGQSIFLEVAREEGGDAELLDLLSSQYAFKRIIQASLKDIDFDDGVTQRAGGRWASRRAFSSIPPNPSAARSRRQPACRPASWQMRRRPKVWSSARRWCGRSRPPWCDAQSSSSEVRRRWPHERLLRQFHLAADGADPARLHRVRRSPGSTHFGCVTVASGVSCTVTATPATPADLSCCIRCVSKPTNMKSTPAAA
jgi:hypothetical protein